MEGPLNDFSINVVTVEVLDLSYNRFEGQMTGGGGLDLPIRVLKLEGNELWGLHPILCIMMPHVEVLTVQDNLFETELAPDWVQCQNLTYFNVANTNFYGQIPSEFGTWTTLKELDLSQNQRIVGSIPSELGILPSLSLLNLTGTMIQGTIPESLCERQREGGLTLSADCNLIECCK